MTFKAHIGASIGTLPAAITAKAAVSAKNIYICIALVAVFAVLALILGTFNTHMAVGANILAHTVGAASALTACGGIFAFITVAFVALAASPSQIKMTLHAHFGVMVAAHSPAAVQTAVANQALFYIRKTIFAIRAVVTRFYGAIYAGPAGIAPLVCTVAAKVASNANIAVIL